MALAVRLFIGGVRPLPPDNEPTGMFKWEQFQSIWLGWEGFAGDQQADRRVHGGPEKAVHLFPADHYAQLAVAFPGTGPLEPGALGENLSVAGLTEDAVRIGDVFRLGDARLQVCQPRSPCWKIDRRLGRDGVMAHIAEHGLTGWYFRVLEEGEVAPGDGLLLLESTPAAPTLAHLWALGRTPQAKAADLLAAAAAPGLAAAWVKRLRDRAAP